MIVDYRIYCTLYAIGYAAHLGSWAISRERVRVPIFWGTVALIGSTALLNFLDCLWS